MKKIFFAYMSYFNKNTHKKEVYITELTDTIEKAAYLLSIFDFNEKEINSFNFYFNNISDNLYELFMNYNGFFPIYRIMDKFTKEYTSYQTLPFLFHDYYNNYESLLKKSKEYLKDPDFNLFYMNNDESIDQQYIYINKKSNNDFSSLDNFLYNTQNVFHKIINEYYECVNYSNLNYMNVLELEKTKKDKNFDLIEKKIFNDNFPEWRYFSEFIEKLNDRNDLYLAITSNINIKGTFAEHNKHHIFKFLNELLKNQNNKSVILILSQVTTLNFNSEEKIKIIAAAIFEKEKYQFLSKEDVIIAFDISNEDLKKDESIVFYEFGKLLKKINIKLE